MSERKSVEMIGMLEAIEKRFIKLQEERDELLEALENLVAYSSKEYPVSEVDEARALIEKVKS